MCLSTLSAVKTNLGGISGSDQDATLTQWLRAASFAIRDYCGQYLGGVISAITKANPASITSIGHGLENGDTISISNSDSGVSINGNQTVTYVDDDKFTVAVDNSAGSVGTKATFVRQYTEYYGGTGHIELILKNRPVQSITSLALDSGGYYGQGDDAFAAASLLTEGKGFVLKRDNAEATEVSESGLVERIGGVWTALLHNDGDLLVAERRPALGNIKVVYLAGYHNLPYHIREACNRLVDELRLTAGKGPMLTEHLDYYDYTRQAASETIQMMSSVKHLLRKEKEWIW